MPKPPDAASGERYITPEGQLLEVVALDNVSETVKIRYDNGRTETLGFSDWYGLQPRSIDTSGDWGEANYGDLDEDDRF